MNIARKTPDLRNPRVRTEDLLRMGLKSLAIAAVILLLSLVVLPISGCKSENTLPPAPASLIHGTRDRLNPFRFTLNTEPSAPNSNDRITLKVHVIDAANQPADGAEVNADVSMTGMNGSRHLTLNGLGGGDYEGEVKLEMAGSWDVDLSATRDGKSSQQRLTIEVGS